MVLGTSPGNWYIDKVEPLYQNKIKPFYLKATRFGADWYAERMAGGTGG
jgi:hypothetical protein